MTERCKRYQRPRESPTVASASEKPLAQASWVYARTSLAPAPPRRARRAASPARRLSAPRERAAVAGGHDEAVAPVAHEPSGGGADRVGGDHRQALVHRLVDHQPPRLAERARRRSTARRARQQAPYRSRSSRGATGSRLTTPRLRLRGRVPPGETESGPHAGQDERGGRRAQTRSTPGPRQHRQPLLAGGATDEQEPDLRSAAGHERSPGAAAGALQKSLSTDWGATCTLRAPRAAHVGADVGSVGDDGVGASGTGGAAAGS